MDDLWAEHSMAIAAATVTALGVGVGVLIAIQAQKGCGGRRRRGDHEFRTVGGETAFLETEMNRSAKVVRAATNKEENLRQKEEVGKSNEEEKKPEGETKPTRRRKRRKNPEKKRLRKERKAREALGLPSVTPNDPPKSATVKTAIADDDGWTSVSYKKKTRSSTRSTGRSNNVNEKGMQQNVSGGVSVSSEDKSPKEEEVSESVRIDSRKVGAIVGPKGVTLHAIQDKTGVKINTPSRKDDKRDALDRSQIPALKRQVVYATISIKGPKKGVKIAKKAIESIATKGFSQLLNPDMTEGHVKIPATALGDIIGPKGKFIKAIQLGTRTNIRTPDRDTSTTGSSSNLLRVYITGKKGDVRNAKESIKSLIKVHWSKHTHPGQTYREIAVPAGKLGHIIGPRGQTVKSIQGDTRTKIHTPSARDENDNIVIVGTEAGIAKAQERIKKIVEEKEDEPACFDEDKDE